MDTARKAGPHFQQAPDPDGGQQMEVSGLALPNMEILDRNSAERVRCSKSIALQRSAASVNTVPAGINRAISQGQAPGARQHPRHT